MINSHKNILFPSFAASPSVSPPKIYSSTDSNLVHKITINLPQSFVESTIDYNNSLEVTSPTEKENSNIRIFCRFKPSHEKVLIKYDENMVDDGENKYSFDSIFGKHASQEDIYHAVGWRHIDSFLKGHNSTIFTYGQTGSGKTYTMFGDLKQKEGYGLIPRILESIFLKKAEEDVITCSILEIYNQKLIDLFDPQKELVEGLKLKEYNDTVIVEGLVQAKVENHLEIMDLIHFGYRDRKTASTYTNDCSSRSHTILFVYRHYTENDKEQKTKLCFIDLAGSQKIRKSGVKGVNLEETKKINLSLSCLGNVVSALTTSADHIPYRNSKLTRILKDSLTGSCRTSIITTCSLNKCDYHETISTIKFAMRAKKIKNKKRLSNVEFTSEEIIQNLKKELAETKKELEFYKNKEKSSQFGETLTDGEIPEEQIEHRPIKMSLCGQNNLGNKLKKQE